MRERIKLWKETFMEYYVEEWTFPALFILWIVIIPAFSHLLINIFN